MKPFADRRLARPDESAGRGAGGEDGKLPGSMAPGLLDVVPPDPVDPRPGFFIDLADQFGRRSDHERPGGDFHPFEQSARSTTDPVPILTRFSRIAPMPIKHSSSTTQPCRMTRWPTVTRWPTKQGMPGSACTIVKSCRFVPSPMRIRSVSPRITV